MAIYKALTIAGSDSGGGAGIQADLKTFQEFGVFGMSVITVVTAQNTLGVQGVYPQSLEAVETQIDSVLSDIGADAVKTGMLYSAEIIRLTARKLRQYDVSNLVVDPVMYAKGGTPLLLQEAMDALMHELLPLATVVTPNMPEACRLCGVPAIESLDQMKEAAHKLLDEFGPAYVLLKGGHLPGGQSVDLLAGRDGDMVTFSSDRIFTKHTHGTGCTLAAAVTAGLAAGSTVEEAVSTAKQFITAAISSSLDIGGGIGPTDHSAYRKQKETRTVIL
ncbi:bifunctional hydroxymethylpyrimidine kinase/phosphomethylpyrimidine kinase [Paenibacillus alkalitolerans]|uniref:bifunctional hydroxymethylpyrimidine kinase/phosphomethylpyrimidine kinase n=1 Tax=Paenibacillus alkalitolerans TaxID=2799335 RepID=UPI0018F41B6A|nr:bifunctional hydroxymethylpyrimidine kinase/phosphomethylpyrimidine kinase [Paenibacillus alkalitolerans]